VAAEVKATYRPLSEMASCFEAPLACAPDDDTLTRVLAPSLDPVAAPAGVTQSADDSTSSAASMQWTSARCFNMSGSPHIIPSTSIKGAQYPLATPCHFMGRKSLLTRGQRIPAPACPL